MQDNSFSRLITDIENLKKEDLEPINNLIEEYPYCQALYMLAARSAVDSDLYTQTLAKAAISVPSRNVLYKFIHQPNKFIVLKDDVVIEESNLLPEDNEVYELVNEGSYDHEDEVFEEIAPLAQSFESEISLHNYADIETEAIENLNLNGEKFSEVLIEEEIPAQEDLVEQNAVVENISQPKEAEGLFVDAKSEDSSTKYQISNYDDEKLPYTFLWWLSKTRKEYKSSITSYASFTLDTTQEIQRQVPDLLDHQIAENIFNVNSVDQIEHHLESNVSFDFLKKEHHIIEKFIKEEPQIKPPVADKIDTENKAKKSSEDTNELVSETLAKVYVEQMLFHKALDVYKKLSLKYPEKSTYFASQIKYLELKVN